MRTTMVRWTESEIGALDRVTARLQRLVPDRTLTRPHVLRVLVQAFASGITPDQLLAAKGEGR